MWPSASKKKLTIDCRVYQLTDVDTLSLFSDKTDKWGPMLKVEKGMSPACKQDKILSNFIHDIEIGELTDH